MQPQIITAFRITRPTNCFIGGLSIAVAAVIAGPVASWLPVAFAVLSGMLFTAAANTINDYFDIDIDRVNRPDRPLPSGLASLQFAKMLAIILFVCGIFFSIFINIFAICIAILSTILLISYSARLKRTVLWGNAAVSLMTAIAFIYGALAAGRWRDGLIPAVYAFLFHFGREILKDMEDVAGDAAAKVQTFPIRFGHLPALKIITSVYTVLATLTIIPYVLGIYNLAYLVTVIIGVDFVLAVVLALLWLQRERANLRLLSGILKADMIVGLLAVYIGK
ncbi:MAG: geranylgeranylglycerol-phosphate geranylgeranyltransferase [bacterium]